MLHMNPAMRSKIGPESDSDEIRRAAVNDGMVQLRISGAQKVAMGLTTIEEVLNVVPPDSEI